MKLDEALEENYALQDKIEDDFSLVKDEFGERNESLSKEFEDKMKIMEEEIHSRDRALEILRVKNEEILVEIAIPKIGISVKSEGMVQPPSRKTMQVSHEESTIYAPKQNQGESLGERIAFHLHNLHREVAGYAGEEQLGQALVLGRI
ncbi:hypothetical protein LWI29_013760 [Acer saccharum]|uniref:Uncharacterized protein n=1 Tax=Acer saccharum TaxID=4024 RepID=A0AA39TEH6_ACESA|nr:hypothetical protein LWI29_013760 [Acer saccharum]